MADDEERLAFALPPLPPGAEFVEEYERGWMDPADADIRSVLIRAAHPEMAAALDAGEDEIVVGDMPVNIRLHFAMHEIVASQLADAQPPEAWHTAQRLRRSGYEHHEILHMLGSAITDQIWAALRGEGTYDEGAHVRALRALPRGWGPPHEPPRRTHERARRDARKAQRAARRRNRRR